MSKKQSKAVAKKAVNTNLDSLANPPTSKKIKAVIIILVLLAILLFLLQNQSVIQLPSVGSPALTPEQQQAQQVIKYLESRTSAQDQGEPLTQEQAQEVSSFLDSRQSNDDGEQMLSEAQAQEVVNYLNSR